MQVAYNRKVRNVQELITCIQNGCIHTALLPKNVIKGEFSKDIQENYELLIVEVSELMEEVEKEEQDYARIEAEAYDVILFAGAIAMEALKRQPSKPKDWC